MEVEMQGGVDWPNRWRHPDVFIERSGPLAPEGFEPSEELKEFIHSEDCKILVVGAGGLGCELLKNLALMGFKDIHVIDMDTIDVSNLNRQFLFRYKDVGKSKAEVAAEFIMKRVVGCTVTPYFGKIQDKDIDYYSQFSIIICGLDSVEARRWMNATIIGMYDEEDPSTLKPIVDGGTEGFKGQSRVIIPKQTACYECSLDMQTKPVTFPICTIANTPRLPEHSTKRAEEFGIRGVTRTLTMGVVKNIIPAIASTNAIVAAATANEVFKLATSCAPTVNNYMMYVGDSSLYTYTFPLEKKDDCPVCGTESLKISIPKTWKLSDLVESLLERQGTQLKKAHLYMQSPKQLEEATRPNLEKLVVDMVEDGETIVVTDASLPISLQLVVKFE
ncbi:hypothetical protein BDR26DRAFT_907205 [Obelidium mucronatum]|nr:hypothetical protein BDR26DRAFT_907205 [Obelidium mucronatum]